MLAISVFHVCAYKLQAVKMQTLNTNQKRLTQNTRLGKS